MKKLIIIATAALMMVSVFADENKTSVIGWKSKFKLGHDQVIKNALETKNKEEELKAACKEHIAMAHKYKNRKELNLEFDPELMAIYISNMKIVCSEFACKNCTVVRPNKNKK